MSTVCLLAKYLYPTPGPVSGRQACKGIYCPRWQVTFTPATLGKVQPIFAALEKKQIYISMAQRRPWHRNMAVSVRVMQDRNTLQVYIPT